MRNLRHSATRLITGVLFTTTLASSTYATVVNSTCYGDQLAGGLLTVHFSAIFGTSILETGSITDTILGDAATHTGYVHAPAYSFDVSGDTILADWTIKNLTVPTGPDPGIEYISKVEIDLRPSGGGINPALFDDNSTPSTPLSGTGVAGIIYNGASTAPIQIFAGESLPWANPSNLGDMYGQETIEWGSHMIAPGEAFIFSDDTDVVPEPGALALLLLGSVLTRRRAHFPLFAKP